MKSHIAVVGAGPVGLAFALATIHGSSALRGVRVTLIERHTLVLAGLVEDDPPSGAQHFDSRVYAISPGSKTFLESFGAWQKIPEERITDVCAMQVWGDDAGENTGEKNKINFEESVAVAHIVEHTVLMNALIETLHASLAAGDDIHLIDNELVATISEHATHRALRLSSGAEIRSDLIVGADGARSGIRDLAGITAKTFDYESDAVVANFKTTLPHENIARQWFHGDSVLAFLPLPDQQISIVWSVSKNRANELLSLDVKTFAETVATAGSHVVGELTLASKRSRVALKKLTARDWVQPQLALIGDAAHAIHPMAGQGANLGFADARALVHALQKRSSFSAVGDMRVLREYERARREDAAAMGMVTHGLRALYLTDFKPVKRVRNQGLRVLDNMPWAKSLVMSHAMK